jgi:omega-amidase
VRLQAWGHSTAIGPFGETLATTEHEPAIVLVDLDLAAIEERRANMPLMAQRRYDLYAVLDKTAP